MTIKLVFSPDDGRVLGAQIVGYEGVDKRIDLLASVIQHKGTVVELTEIEHAYAPPYSSAKDPVNIVGFVAENVLLERAHTSYASPFSHTPQAEYYPWASGREADDPLSTR